MPVLWTVFHDRRLVVISVKGIARLGDMKECVDGIITPATQSYAKHLELSEGQLALSRDDLADLAEYVRERSGTGTLGALAITVGSDKDEQQARLFASLSASDRPVKIFRQFQSASIWLDTRPSQTFSPWPEEARPSEVHGPRSTG